MSGRDHTAPGMGASSQHSGYGDISSENLRRSSFQEYIALLMRGKWLILASVLLLTAASAVWTYLTKPVFEATSMVLIDMKGTAGAMPFLDITGASSNNKITNEIETLRSYSMAEDVARTLLE
ncbi:MAG TPA: Wzz/FepE/Etk N-terminal domain-containing protein, partial [Bacteroidota bacterium]